METISKMNPNSFGVNLTKSQKLWLSEVVRLYFEGKKPDLISIFITISDNLDESFDFMNFDNRLIRHDGAPTFFGIWVDNSEHEIIIIVHRVLETIRNNLKANPSIRRFVAKDIANQIKAKQEDVEMCFDLIFSIGGYANSGSRSTGKQGFEAIEIDNV